MKKSAKIYNFKLSICQFKFLHLDRVFPAGYLLYLVVCS